MNSRNEAVGMLYVGYLEQPYKNVMFTHSSRYCSFSLLLERVEVGWHGAGRAPFSKPLEQMNETISAIEAGKIQTRIGTIDSDNEIGHVAKHLDSLLGLLNKRNLELKPGPVSWI